MAGCRGAEVDVLYRWHTNHVWSLWWAHTGPARLAEYYGAGGLTLTGGGRIVSPSGGQPGTSPCAPPSGSAEAGSSCHRFAILQIKMHGIFIQINSGIHMYIGGMNTGDDKTCACTNAIQKGSSRKLAVCLRVECRGRPRFFALVCAFPPK